jgi:hypothetical protein
MASVQHAIAAAASRRGNRAAAHAIAAMSHM